MEFTRLGRCFLDWATAVAGEADRELTCVTFTIDPFKGSLPSPATAVAQSRKHRPNLVNSTVLFLADVHEKIREFSETLCQ